MCGHASRIAVIARAGPGFRTSSPSVVRFVIALATALSTTVPAHADFFANCNALSPCPNFHISGFAGNNPGFVVDSLGAVSDSALGIVGAGGSGFAFATAGVGTVGTRSTVTQSSGFAGGEATASASYQDGFKVLFPFTTGFGQLTFTVALVGGVAASGGGDARVIAGLGLTSVSENDPLAENDNQIGGLVADTQFGGGLVATNSAVLVGANTFTLTVLLFPGINDLSVTEDLGTVAFTGDGLSSANADFSTTFAITGVQLKACEPSCSTSNITLTDLSGLTLPGGQAPNTVPEPSSLAMTAPLLLGVFVAVRRRKKK